MASGVPEIGVKLTPQGLQDVIAAFAQVRTKGVATGTEVAAGFDIATASVEALEAASGALVALLPALSFVAAAAGLEHMVSSSLSAEEAIGKLSQKTGGSVETLSVLSMVAGDVGVDLEALSGGLVKLAKNQEAASNGEVKQAAAFKALGISLNDLKTLDPASLFLRMGAALDAMADGPKKTSITLATMGKAAAELLPVLDELGVDGFAKATEKARTLGLLLDQDTVNAARAAKMSFRELGDIADGLAIRFTNGLAPALAQGMEEFAQAVEGDGVDSMKTFGEESGKAFKYVIAGAILLKDVVVGAFKAIKEEVSYYGGEMAAVADGYKKGSKVGLGAAGGALGLAQYEAENRKYHDEAVKDATDDLASQFKDDAAKLQDFLNTPPTVRKFKNHGSAGADGNGISVEQLQKTEDARAKYLQAAADNELALLKASNEQKDQEDKRLYDGGLLSLDEYYARRAARIKAEASAEDAILQTKRQGALGVKTPQAADATEARLQKAADSNTATPEQYKRLEEAQKVDAAIVESRQAAESKIRQNAQDEANARHALSLQELEDVKKLQEASGDKYGAEETGLTEEIQKYKELLEKTKQFTQAEIDAKANAFQTKGQAKIDFGRTQEKYSDSLADMNDQIGSVQDDAANGSISQVAADAQILAIEQQRIPVLQQLADLMVQYAAASGDDKLAQTAKQTEAAVTHLHKSLTDVTTAQTYLFNQLSTQGRGDVEDFFSSIIDGSKNSGDAIKDLATQFESMVAKMIAKLLIFYALEALLGWVDPDSSYLSDLTKAGPFGKFAAGGFTANVPISQAAGIVHGQEWVANADQTRRYKGLFAAISAGQELPLAGPGSSAALANNSVAASVAKSSDGSSTRGFGPAPVIQVINATGQATQQKQTTGGNGQSITQIIVGAVQKDIAAGGAIAKQIEGQYSVARGGTRRG